MADVNLNGEVAGSNPAAGDCREASGVAQPGRAPERGDAGSSPAVGSSREAGFPDVAQSAVRPTPSERGDVSRRTCRREPRHPWTPADVARLEKLIALGIARATIADILGREHCAVRSKISRLGIGKPYRKPVKWRKADDGRQG